MLFVTVSAAEGASWALSYAPSSQVLWYINLKWFVFFQKSHYVLSAYFSGGYFQLFCIALPLFLAACLGFALKRRLLLAIASNLSLVYAIFLPYCWYANGYSSQQASLKFMSVPTRGDDYLCLVLLMSCIISFCVSHVYYLMALRGR